MVCGTGGVRSRTVTTFVPRAAPPHASARAKLAVTAGLARRRDLAPIQEIRRTAVALRRSTTGAARCPVPRAQTVNWSRRPGPIGQRDDAEGTSRSPGAPAPRRRGRHRRPLAGRRRRSDGTGEGGDVSADVEADSDADETGAAGGADRVSRATHAGAVNTRSTLPGTAAQTTAAPRRLARPRTFSSSDDRGPRVLRRLVASL